MFAEYFENLKHKGEPCTDTSADYRTGYQFDDGMGSVFPPLENEIRTLHENGKERGGEGGDCGVVVFGFFFPPTLLSLTKTNITTPRTGHEQQ